MAETTESKKEEADYKRLHSFPLIRVRHSLAAVTHMWFTSTGVVTGFRGVNDECCNVLF